MKIGFVSSLTALLAGTSLALAQAPIPPGSLPNNPVAPSPAYPQAAPMTGAYSLGTPAAMGPEAVADSCGHDGPIDCGTHGPECHPPRVWAAGEYLLWRISGSSLPPSARITFSEPVNLTNVVPGALVVQPNGTLIPLTAAASQGVVAVTTTQPLFPIGGTFNNGDLTGMRWTAGVALDPEGNFFVEGTYFQLFPHTEDSGVAPALPIPLSGTVNLPVVPFLNTNLGTTTVLATTPPTTVTTFPVVNSVTATLSGNVNVNGHISQETKLWGAEVNFGGRTCSLFADRIDLLAGVRYLDLTEVMNLDTSTVIGLNPGPAVDANGNAVAGLQFANPVNGGAQAIPLSGFPFGISSHDQIRTQNQFYGAQVGIRGQWDIGRFFIEGFGKVAVGEMHEVVDIASSQTISGMTYPGGFLATAADIGHHTRNKMGLVPEGSFTAGVFVFPWLKAYVGYDFLWIDKVAQPGDQVSFGGINNSVSLQLSTGPNITVPIQSRPAGFSFNESAIWVQGLTFGVELQF